MKQYEVTVTIPVYNVASYVEASLLSALNQTFQSIEFLIVDDKGQDGSMDIVNRVIKNHPRSEDIRVIDQGYNQKTGAARNAGLDNAAGKYLFFLDSDDVISSRCIEILYEAMRRHPVDFVSASFVRRDDQGNIYSGCLYSEDILVGTGKYAVVDYCYGQGYKVAVSLCNRLYDINFLRRERIRCIPEETHEDAWFTYQVLFKAKSCRLLPDCTLFYTYNPTSSTGSFSTSGYSENTARQFTDIQRRKSEYIEPYIAEKFYRGVLVDIMKMSLYHAYQVEISSLIDVKEKKVLELELLSPPIILPAKGNKSGYSYEYLLYRLFFRLPMMLRRLMLKIGGMMKVKSLLRRWIHF